MLSKLDHESKNPFRYYHNRFNYSHPDAKRRRSKIHRFVLGFIFAQIGDHDRRYFSWNYSWYAVRQQAIQIKKHQQ